MSESSKPSTTTPPAPLRPAAPPNPSQFPNPADIRRGEDSAPLTREKPSPTERK